MFNILLPIKKYSDKRGFSWLINENDKYLDVVGTSVASRSNCEILLINRYATDSSVLWYPFCSNVSFLRRDDCQKAWNGRALMPLMLTFLFEVSLSVKQITVNEMKIKWNTWLHLANVTVKKNPTHMSESTFSNWSPLQPQMLSTNKTLESL